MDPWVVEVVWEGYRIPFRCPPPLSGEPIPMPSYNPLSTKGVALEEVTLDLIAKGAVELASLPSLGFYSRLFVVWKTSGSWRPVIDLSTLNRFVDVSHFQMETLQSVLLSIRPGDWMASIDLREAYLQVPVHPESRPFLRFVINGQVYQFKALCFGLSTAPQVFTWVMAPVSAILHSLGIHMRHYLDDWLVQSLYASLSSRISRWSWTSGAGYCGQPQEVQPRSISGCPVSRGDHQYPVFCGFSVARSRLQASVNRRRISVLRLASLQCLALSAGDAFLPRSPRPRWETTHAVPPDLPSPVLESGGPVDPCPLVSGLPSGFAVGASLAPSVSGGASSSGVSRPRLLVRRLGRRLGGASRPSCRFRPLGRVGGSALYQRQGAPCRPSGSPPLPVVSFGRHHGRGVSSQLHRSRDTPLVGVARHPSGSAPAPSYRVVPQHGGLSIFASSVASPDRLICHLGESPLFDLFLQSWDSLQAYAFPPWSIIPRVLAKLRESQGTELTLVAPFWPLRPWFPDLLQLSLAPPVVLPDRPDLLLLPRSRLLYQGLLRLRFHAWRLSGASPERRVSRPQ